MGCSREQALKNLKKAWEKSPRPQWRSPEESRLVRMFVWQWLLGRGPECSGYALAKWLGVDAFYVRYLKKKLPADPVTGQAEFDREVARNGAPTVEALRAARVKSRSMRAQGLLLTQPRWKEITEPGAKWPKSIPIKPNAVTLALDGRIPLEPPGKHPPRRTRRKNHGGCSIEQARENLKKAWAKYKPPRPWRSPEESWLVRMFVWQWLLGRGPTCSARALTRWLGLHGSGVRDLKKKLPMDEGAFLREVALHGVPTLEALQRAREKSRWMREQGLLRTQRPYRPVQVEWGGALHREMVPIPPNNVTRVLNGLTPLQPPGKIHPGQAPPDEFSTRMWQLTMREERKNKVKPVIPRRSRRSGAP